MVAVELKMVALAAILLFVQIVIAAAARVQVSGLDWAAGPRDAPPAGELSVRGARSQRALRNMQETFPIFTALAIGVVVAGLSNWVTVLGSELYVIARVLYVPAYIVYIPFLRTGLFALSVAGIVLTGGPLFLALVS